MEDHPLSAVRDYLFSIFAATTLHILRPSYPSATGVRTRYAVVTGTLRRAILKPTVSFPVYERGFEGDPLTTSKLLVPQLFLTEQHAMKAYWGSGGIAPRIVDLGTTWK
jgi:hypothetical protein